MGKEAKKAKKTRKIQKIQMKEKNIRKLKLLSIVTALAAGALAVLYLFDILQNWWVMDFILILGSLLEIVLTIILFVRNKNILAGIALVMAVFFIGTLIYFNLV